MAALVKGLLQLILLVGILSLLTVSTSAEDVKVTFVVEQRLESHGVLLISGNISSLSPPRTMTLIPNGVWVLTVTLTKGVAYEYSVRVLPAANLFVCICRNEGNDPKLLTVPENYPSSYYAELVSGYDCNVAVCPRYNEANPTERIRQGKNVTVTIVVPQHLENGGVLKIVGNSTELGNSNAFEAPVMTLTPKGIWVLTVTLSGGVTYELNVVVLPRNAFFECYCTPRERHVLSVPSEGDYHVVPLTGYDCNNVPCPRLLESKMFNAIRRVV